jgi:hypothetical protein
MHHVVIYYEFTLFKVALLQDNMDERYRVSKLTHLAVFGTKKLAPAFGASQLFWQ